MNKLILLLVLIIFCNTFLKNISYKEGLEKEENECCIKKPKSEPTLHYMRKHSHKQNPKIMKYWNNINNLLEKWLEKTKKPVYKEPDEAPYKLIKEENAKIDEHLARIKDNEMKQIIESSPKKKRAYPIDLDVVLNDEITKPLENFTGHRAFWGFGPKVKVII